MLNLHTDTREKETDIEREGGGRGGNSETHSIKSSKISYLHK